MTLNDQPINWYSRRQDLVTQSATEAEYVACAEGAKDASWGRQFLEELLGVKLQPVVYTDNNAAEKLCKTTGYHRRTRHIEHRQHYIRQEVTLGHISVMNISGKENPADMLTKLKSCTEKSVRSERYITRAIEPYKLQGHANASKLRPVLY